MLQRLYAVIKHLFFFSVGYIFKRAMTLRSWLDNRGIVVRFSVGQVNFMFSKLCRRPREAHPAFFSVGTGCCLLGDAAISLFRGVRRKFYLSYFEVEHPVVMKIQ